MYVWPWYVWYRSFRMWWWPLAGYKWLFKCLPSVLENMHEFPRTQIKCPKFSLAPYGRSRLFLSHLVICYVFLFYNFLSFCDLSVSLFRFWDSYLCCSCQWELRRRNKPQQENSTTPENNCFFSSWPVFEGIPDEHFALHPKPASSGSFCW